MAKIKLGLPKKEGYYWAQFVKNMPEFEVVQVVEDSPGRFTVYRCGDDRCYDIEEFKGWGEEIIRENVSEKIGYDPALDEDDEPIPE